MKLHLCIFGLSFIIFSGGCGYIVSKAPLLTKENSDFVSGVEGAYKSASSEKFVGSFRDR